MKDVEAGLADWVVNKPTEGVEVSTWYDALSLGTLGALQRCCSRRHESEVLPESVSGTRGFLDVKVRVPEVRPFDSTSLTPKLGSGVLLFRVCPCRL